MKNLMALISLFFIISCGMKETLVSNMDSILYHKTSTKFDLDSKQKTALKASIKKFLTAQQKKTKEAKELIQTLDLSQKDEIAPTYRGFIELYREIAISYSEVLADLMSTLDKKQQATFIKEFIRENKELEDKIIDSDPTDYFTRFRFFFGSINDLQKKTIVEHSDFFREQSRHRLKNRIILLKAIEEAFKEANSKKKIYEAFRVYNTESFPKQKEMIKIIKLLVDQAEQTQIKTFNEKKMEALEIIDLFAKSKY